MSDQTAPGDCNPCPLCNEPVTSEDHRRRFTCTYKDCPALDSYYHNDCVETYLRGTCKCAGDRMAGFPCPATLSNGKNCSGAVHKTHTMLPTNKTKKQKRVEQAAHIDTHNKAALEEKRALTRQQQAEALERKKAEKAAEARILAPYKAADMPTPVTKTRVPKSSPEPTGMDMQALRAAKELLQAQARAGTSKAEAVQFNTTLRNGSIVLNPRLPNKVSDAKEAQFKAALAGSKTPWSAQGDGAIPGMEYIPAKGASSGRAASGQGYRAAPVKSAASVTSSQPHSAVHSVFGDDSVDAYADLEGHGEWASGPVRDPHVYDDSGFYTQDVMDDAQFAAYLLAQTGHVDMDSMHGAGDPMQPHSSASNGFTYESDGYQDPTTTSSIDPFHTSLPSDHVLTDMYGNGYNSASAVYDSAETPAAPAEAPGAPAHMVPSLQPASWGAGDYITTPSNPTPPPNPSQQYATLQTPIAPFTSNKMDRPKYIPPSNLAFAGIGMPVAQPTPHTHASLPSSNHAHVGSSAYVQCNTTIANSSPAPPPSAALYQTSAQALYPVSMHDDATSYTKLTSHTPVPALLAAKAPVAAPPRSPMYDDEDDLDVDDLVALCIS